MDDLDLDFDPDPDPDRDVPASGGFVRATITPRGVWLNPPSPGLVTGGPASLTLGRLAGRAVVVDLRFVGPGESEIIATVPPNAPRLQARAAAALARWAATVGYCRLWLPGRVLDLEDRSGGTATVECPACTSVWSDASPRFWETVRRNGCFPGYCPACGLSLPEWRVRRRPGGAPVEAPVERTARR